MTSPPGLTTASPNLRANGERKDQFLSARIVAREAAKILSTAGIDIRPAVLRRLVTTFINTGHTTLRELEPFILGYADPTGERAVRNAMRAGA